MTSYTLAGTVLALILPSVAIGSSPAQKPPADPIGFKANEAVYAFEAEAIEGRTLKPRLPFARFDHLQPLRLSPPVARPETDKGQRDARTKGRQQTNAR